MSLICIIAGLLLERMLETLQQLRNFQWFEKYSQWMINHMPGLIEQGASSIVILLLPVMLLAGLIQNILADTFFDIFSLIYGFVVFVYCLGPGDLDKEIDCFLTARETADEDMAHKCASAIMGEDASRSPDQQIVDVTQNILYQSNDRFFAVIFWFVVLGPFGALLYRLTSYTSKRSNNKTLTAAARRLKAILAWAPAHLVAAGYALTGNYEGASEGFKGKQKKDELNESNYNTLVSAGLGALKNCTPGEETACIRSTRGLVLRTLIVWLALIALLTLMGWTS